MLKVMVRMLCIYCGSKDVSQMGGAIVVCGGGKDIERERESGYVVSCVCVCVCRRLRVETHFSFHYVVHFWSIPDI